MKTETIKSIKELILSKIGVSFNKECHDVFFKPYTPDEDEDPEVIYEQDGVKVTIEWEYGDVFIEGLTKEEQIEICK